MYSYVAIFIFVAAFTHAYPSKNSATKPVDRTDISINDFFDEHLPDIVPLIKKFRFDPMSLPNISQSLGPFTLNLDNGVMYGASNLTRGGDSMISFYPDFWRFQVHVHLSELICKFNYTASAWIGSLGGVFNATIRNASATMSVDLSIPTFILSNPQIQIDDVGIVSVNFGSESFGGYVYNLFVSLATAPFRDRITQVAESTALQVANVTVSMLNKNVRQTIHNVDRYVGSFLAGLRYTVVGDKTPQDVDHLLAPYIKNASNTQPKDNPFKDLDKWLASTWDKTSLIWNETFGTQAMDNRFPGSRPSKPSGSKPSNNPFAELDKLLASQWPSNPTGSKPTRPGQKPTSRPNIDWDQIFGQINPTKKPTVKPTVKPRPTPAQNNPTKRPNKYDDPLANFDKIAQDSWIDTFGNKSPGQVFADIFQQSVKEVIQDEIAAHKKPRG